MSSYTEMAPLTFSSKSQSCDFNATNNTSSTSKAYTQALFDSTSKPYTKSMIEDVAIEMLRMELHDKANQYEVRLPYATYSGKNETVQKQHFMKQLEAQKIHDMSNMSDNQFTRWDSMRELRDERFNRIDKVRLYREHQNLWPVYKYGYDKAMNLHSGLVYLKSPKLEPSIRSRTFDNSSDLDQKNIKSKKSTKSKKKSSQKALTALESEVNTDDRIARSSMVSSLSAMISLPPTAAADATDKSPSNSHRSHQVSQKKSSLKQSPTEEDGSSVGSVIGALTGPHTTHTKPHLAPLVPPTPGSVSNSLFDDSISLPSLELIGRVFSDKSMNHASSSPDKSPTSINLAGGGVKEGKSSHKSNNGIESNYCRVSKFFPSTPTNDATHSNISTQPSAAFHSHSAHSSSKPPLPMTDTQQTIHAQRQAIRKSHQSFLQRQRQYQQSSLPRQSPHYYVKRRPDPDAPSQAAPPTIRLHPLEANMYFEFSD